jgi:hypothetical protein
MIPLICQHGNIGRSFEGTVILGAFLTNCSGLCYSINRILEVFAFMRPRRLFDFVVFFIEAF